MKCINCNAELGPKGKWCSIRCKSDFYNDNYAGSNLAIYLEDEYNTTHKLIRDEALKKFKVWKDKNPKRGIVDYILQDEK